MQLGLPFLPPEPAKPRRAEPLEPSEPPQPFGLSEPLETFEPVEPVEPPVQFYFVRHRQARRYLLRVEPDGRVRVTIPRGGSRREADAFAIGHLDWIARQRARLPVHAAPSADERRALIRQARQQLPPRVLQFAEAHGLVVTRVSIRNQRSRWGSCGRDGHICLNWRLVRMPDWVRDYVIIHELMHLRRMDHSPAYWALVEAAFPAHKAARHWLRAHGRGL